MRRTWDPTIPAIAAGILMLVGTMAATGGIAPGQWRGKLGSDPRSVWLDLRLAEGSSQTRISMDVAATELGGFDAATFRRTGAPLRLAWKRDAGTFVFEGEGGRRPGGKVHFERDAAFAERWRALGFETLRESDFLRMAVDNVTLADAERLNALGLHPALDDFFRLRAHGVSMDDMQAFQAAGVHVDIETLIRLSTHGVDAAYAKGMIDAGVAKDDVDGILQLHAHGVPTEYAARVRSSGYSDIGVADLVRLHDQGVDSGYVRSLVESHLPGMSLDDVVRLHAHGVPADYVSAIVEIGPGRRDTDDVIRLHNHGVRVDFVRSLVQAGGQDLPVDDVIRATTLGPESLGKPVGSRESR